MKLVDTTRMISAAEFMRALVWYNSVPYNNWTIAELRPTKSVSFAVSSLLTQTLSGARCSKGGHIPDSVVQRVQNTVISPHGVAHTWGPHGRRLVVAKPTDDGRMELVATMLVACDTDHLFFFTGKFNNIKSEEVTSLIKEIDHQLVLPTDYIPKGYTHVANFAVAAPYRKKGAGRWLIETALRQVPKGLWLLADPPWLRNLMRTGFRPRRGAESFFVDDPKAPLPSMVIDDVVISNVHYNKHAGVPDQYGSKSTAVDIPHRMPQVCRMLRDPRFKLQYVQMLMEPQDA